MEWRASRDAEPFAERRRGGFWEDSFDSILALSGVLTSHMTVKTHGATLKPPKLPPEAKRVLIKGINQNTPNTGFKKSRRSSYLFKVHVRPKQWWVWERLWKRDWWQFGRKLERREWSWGGDPEWSWGGESSPGKRTDCHGYQSWLPRQKL